MHMKNAGKKVNFTCDMSTDRNKIYRVSNQNWSPWVTQNKCQLYFALESRAYLVNSTHDFLKSVFIPEIQKAI